MHCSVWAAQSCPTPWGAGNNWRKKTEFIRIGIHCKATRKALHAYSERRIRTYIYHCHDHTQCLYNKSQAYKLWLNITSMYTCVMPCNCAQNEEYSHQCLWQVQKCLCIIIKIWASEINSLSVSSSQTPSRLGSDTNSLWRIHPVVEKYRMYLRHRVFFSSWYSSSVPLALPQKKVPQATDRNSKHPYIGWAISWPLSQYPQCLHLFTILLALTPTLPPSVLLCSYWLSEL